MEVEYFLPSTWFVEGLSYEWWKNLERDYEIQLFDGKI